MLRRIGKGDDDDGDNHDDAERHLAGLVLEEGVAGVSGGVGHQGRPFLRTAKTKSEMGMGGG